MVVTTPSTINYKIYCLLCSAVCVGGVRVGHSGAMQNGWSYIVISSCSSRSGTLAKIPNPNI